ncbi:MAG: type II toxin-antitoxin system YoeB family toxin [Solobacterium sp.]|nr:type II toxin-antitoxin system YoeB family toxin [Solobacterium sp.]
MIGVMQGRLLMCTEENSGGKAKTCRLQSSVVKPPETPYQGIGKPLPLKEDRNGYWHRRIVYKAKDGVLIIAACLPHYED